MVSICRKPLSPNGHYHHGLHHHHPYHDHDHDDHHHGLIIFTRKLFRGQSTSVNMSETHFTPLGPLPKTFISSRYCHHHHQRHHHHYHYHYHHHRHQRHHQPGLIIFIINDNTYDNQLSTIRLIFFVTTNTSKASPKTSSLLLS